MRKRKLYSTEYEDVPETIFNPPDRPSVFIPTRFDWYLQAAFQGFCTNPSFAKETQDTIASLAIGHTVALLNELDSSVLDIQERDRPAPDGDSEDVPE